LRIASYAHRGQVDKSGVAYIEHPKRVSASLSELDEKIVGLLHDAVEDADDPEFIERMLRVFFPDQIIEAVLAVSRRGGESPDEYYARVRVNDLALRVKVADLNDNSSPGRLAKLDTATQERLRAKYAHAREAL